MDETNDVYKMDGAMLPGFRFHPTDEELVGFYLKRKVQQRTLSIELIKQLDIYKYDPWDLPKLATTGEKEWYFYCPRDRKYRNSARPNRVTGAGFWKATGTDRPIYSSEGNRCIGLKKSLVFYRGRAAKGIKTDWMMHEFRLPSLVNLLPTKGIMDRSATSLPANELQDSWAICRIFKKTSSTAHRAISHSWVSPVSELTSSDLLAKNAKNTQFSSQNMSLTTNDVATSPGILLNYNNELHHNPTNNPLNFSSHRPMNSFTDNISRHLPSSGELSSTSNSLFCPLETFTTSNCPSDVSSVLFNMSSPLLGENFGSVACESIGFNGSQKHRDTFSLTSVLEEIVGDGNGNENASLKHLNATQIDDQWETISPIDFPFSLPMSIGIDHAWDSSLWPTDQMPISSGTTT